MKITERDKVLLVLLGVILIVALAVVLPGVGVMSCREQLQTIGTDSEELQKELDEKLAELNAMGVTRYQEDRVKAADYLEDTIYDLKVEASHLAGNVMAYAKPYAVDENWVRGLEYLDGITSDESEKVISYDYVTDVSSTGGKEPVVFGIDGTSFSLPHHEREIKNLVAANASRDPVYQQTAVGTMVEYVYDNGGVEASDASLGAYLLFLHNITSKGSMLIKGAKYGGERSVSFTLLMPPENSGITRYAQEVQDEEARRAAEENGEELED